MNSVFNMQWSHEFVLGHVQETVRETEATNFSLLSGAIHTS